MRALCILPLHVALAAAEVCRPPASGDASTREPIEPACLLPPPRDWGCEHERTHRSCMSAAATPRLGMRAQAKPSCRARAHTSPGIHTYGKYPTR